MLDISTFPKCQHKILNLTSENKFIVYNAVLATNSMRL